MNLDIYNKKNLLIKIVITKKPLKNTNNGKLLLIVLAVRLLALIYCSDTFLN